MGEPGPVRRGGKGLKAKREGESFSRCQMEEQLASLITAGADFLPSERRTRTHMPTRKHTQTHTCRAASCHSGATCPAPGHQRETERCSALLLAENKIRAATSGGALMPYGPAPARRHRRSDSPPRSPSAHLNPPPLALCPATLHLRQPLPRAACVTPSPSNPGRAAAPPHRWSERQTVRTGPHPSRPPTSCLLAASPLPHFDPSGATEGRLLTNTCQTKLLDSAKRRPPPSHWARAKGWKVGRIRGTSPEFRRRFRTEMR